MKIKATTHIRHDGISYAPDDEFEVSDQAGAQLVEMGAAILIPNSGDENKGKKGKG